MSEAISNLGVRTLAIQRSVHDFEYPVLVQDPARIREACAATLQADEHEQDLKQLLHQIKYGTMHAADPCIFPAKKGLHGNEGLSIGLIGKFSSLEICSNKVGQRIKKKVLPATDLHPLIVSLPGHADGRIREDCGVMLRHGEDVVSADGITMKKAVEQFRHCNNIRCPVCFRNVIYSKAFDIAERLEACRTMLRDNGYYLAKYYHIVLSPPKLHTDPNANLRAFTAEGFKDLRRTAAQIMQEAGALGGAIIAHHYAQDGEDGIENAEITGNTGDPYFWRVSPHFHALAIFDGYVPVRELAEIGQRYGGWTVSLAGKDYKKALIENREDLQDKAFYIYSHASVMEPQDGGRRLDSITYFGAATHAELSELVVEWEDKAGRRVRSPQPLLQEGYTEHDERGEILYWYDDLRRFAPQDMAQLAEREKVNAARVYCRTSERKACAEILQDLRSELHLDERDQFPPGPLWARICKDRRFFTSFEPMQDLPDMRRPRKLQVDGEQLWIFEGDDLIEQAEAPLLSEYERFCMMKDAEEAELIATGVLSHV